MRIADMLIVAPVSNLTEVRLVAEAGAGEVYCGALFPEWEALYGTSDIGNRRQGRRANVTSPDTLREMAQEARRLGVPAALTLNVAYTTEQMAHVLKLADFWCDAGGAAVIVSDPGLLVGLNSRNTALAKHLSLLATACNSAAVSFFRDLGVSRVVLPRSLRLAEMAEIIAACRDTDFQVMALNEKCTFIDGLCGFYHGQMFPNGVASDFVCERPAPDVLPVVYAHDLAYAGHGCELPFRLASGEPLRPPHRDDAAFPHCAACQIADLAAGGVRFLKIGGRGLATGYKVRAVRFLREALALARADAGPDLPRAMRRLYERTHGQECTTSRCYYQ